MRVKPDPPVREDGLCYVCLRPRSEAAVLHEDPFCSTPCCRRFHGTEADASDGIVITQ